MGDETNYGNLQNPVSDYSESKNPTSPYSANASPGSSEKKSIPEVEFLFFVLSSAKHASMQQFVQSSFTWVKTIWTPKDEDTQRFEVKMKWDGTLKTIADADGTYKRIDIPKVDAPPKAMALVNENFMNAGFEPIVPVFICNAAWDELNDKDPPRDGESRGFTLTKSLPGFSGERAILLFSSAALPRSLAHELSHWCGFSHSYYENSPDNIGKIGGGGLKTDRDQLRRFFQWATDIEFRKRLGGV